jgi:hypothetical protein
VRFEGFGESLAFLDGYVDFEEMGFAGFGDGVGFAGYWGFALF